MQKLISHFVFLLFALSLSAQGAKKYVLIEHFTNSNCGVCANRNPAFYNLITQAQYADDVHHVSIHPMFPYPSCVFYQANTTENSQWTAQYPVQGTPTIVLNGALQTPSNPLLTEAKLQTYLNQTSPLYLQVTESGTGNARSVNVKARAVGDIPSGDYRIFVAVLEKTVNQPTGNGESVHRDVFRKMLTAVAGDVFTPPTAGNAAEFNYNFNLSGNWNANEVYVLAFVKETSTKQVLNSGTRFDPVLSDAFEIAPMQLRIVPNPVQHQAFIDLGDDRPQTLEVFNAAGQRFSGEFSENNGSVTLSTARLASGIYFVKVAGSNGVYVGKFVKE
ncbi:MAG: Omp28-related outer membrane protein [Saprospiraceae bacterium]|nr:Omp28-related outer membrane protein [Saprospiraceae bacterium]